MKIAFGTTSSNKEKYTKEVLKNLEIDAELVPIMVTSGVADQPLFSVETQSGARNRAQAAFVAVPGADFGLGIEVGYEETAPGRYSIFAWAAAVDAKGVTDHRSDALLLPLFHNNKVVGGDYLGNHVREYLERVGTGIGRKLATHIIERDTIIKTAVYHCLLIHLNRSDF